MSNDNAHSGREAAHIFLDLVQVANYGEEAFNLASQRFLESGSVTADFDEETRRLDLDFSRMITGALAIIQPMISATAKDWGTSVDETVERYRGLIDQSMS